MSLSRCTDRIHVADSEVYVDSALPFLSACRSHGTDSCSGTTSSLP